MDDKQMAAILIMLIPQIIEEIVNNENISEDQASEDFYNSKVYSTLENEKTKLWHLSPKAIFELYRQEKVLGEIVFPEEV